MVESIKRYAENFAIPKDFVKSFKDKLAEDNAKRAVAFSTYLIVVQIVLQILNALKGSGDNSAMHTTVQAVAVPIFYYIILSLGLLLTGIAFRVVFAFVRKGKIIGAEKIITLSNALLYTYVIITFAFNCLNMLAVTGIFSYVTMVVMIGALPIISPKQSIVSISLCFLATIGVAFATRNVSGTWDQLLSTDMWTSLIIITAFMIVSSVAMYKVYRDNFVKEKLLIEAQEEMFKLATTDQLTGCSNRNAMYKHLDTMWESASKNKYSVAVALIDIDFFKSYNDGFGHMEGDECLRKVAASLKSSFRRSYDLVARFGGEEFLIAYKSEPDKAFDMAETMRKAVEATHISHARKDVSDYVTISVGVCTVFPEEYKEYADIIKAADAALYQSKSNGRNRVTVCTNENVPESESEVLANALSHSNLSLAGSQV